MNWEWNIEQQIADLCPDFPLDALKRALELI
jgi:hypothetical protein